MQYTPVPLLTWYAEGLRWIVSLCAPAEPAGGAEHAEHADEIVAETRRRLSTYY